MFPFPSWMWEWNGGWGWVAGFFGVVIGLVILAVPWFFFLLNLQNLLQRVELRNRAMPAGHVWLNFIPIFNLGWFIYTVVKVRDSVLAEYATRGWAPERDQGYNVGLVTGVLAIASFFLGWVPVIGWGVVIAELVCWILYWLKTSEIKNRLRVPAAWPYGNAGTHGGAAAYGATGTSGNAGSYGGASAGYGASSGHGATDAQAHKPTPPSTPATPPPATPTQPPMPVALPQRPESRPAPGMQPSPALQPSPGPQAEPTSPGPAPRTTASRSSAPPVAASRPPTLGDVAADRKRVCAACGTEYLAGDRFCRTCGLKLP